MLKWGGGIGRFAGFAGVVLATLVLAVSSPAIGQIVLDDTEVGYSNDGWLNFINPQNSNVNHATVGPDASRLMNYGTITTANVRGENYYQSAGRTGHISNLGTIHILSVGGGMVDNGLEVPIGTIHSANISGTNGTLVNLATIDTVTISAGWIYNLNHPYSSVYGTHGTIDTMNVIGGQVNNGGFATIDTVFFAGGTVNNISRIEQLTYFGGTYNGKQIEEPWWGSVVTGTGTIGTLTVAGLLNASGSNNWWGEVESVQFAQGRGGVLSLVASYNNSIFSITNTMTAGSVDFTYGVILVDLFGGTASDFLGEEFFFAEIFGANTRIENMENLVSFGVQVGGVTEWILQDRVFADG